MSGIVERSKGSSPLRVVILDVGHGNCTVVEDGEQLAVIDAPKTLVLPRFLTMHSKNTINRLVLSHADEDHIGGAQALLANSAISVQELWLNPNSRQHSKTYMDLLTAAQYRHQADGLRVSTNLNIGAQDGLSFGRITVEILHPDIISAGVGPNDSGHPIGQITSNGMSAVLRISLMGRPSVLLTGDMDARALESLLATGAIVEAPVLVFPHHGGSAGARDDRQFAASLCEAVKPELIVFSIGRRRYMNPSTEIMAGIRGAAPDAHIACTQLSRRCQAIELTSGDMPHIMSDLPSAGVEKGISCAGSLAIDWGSDKLQYRPVLVDHRDFVTARIATPLCRQTAGK
jgi:beta-lactamase superfamily II metal-dependent hydrolase